jgi:hypothetical protein
MECALAHKSVFTLAHAKVTRDACKHRVWKLKQEALGGVLAGILCESISLRESELVRQAKGGSNGRVQPVELIGASTSDALHLASVLCTNCHADVASV